MSFLSKLKPKHSRIPSRSPSRLSTASPAPSEPPSYKPVRETCGLFQLFCPSDGQPCTVDIVAVHGLLGDYEKTWTDDNGAFWLRDFLPTQIPVARIFSYGYDSRVAFTKSVTDITDEAAMLLDRLDGERRSEAEKKRPIVFVSYSLGGIVVKKAMIVANTRSRYSSLLEHIKGSLFLGVPHRGADNAFWGAFAASLLQKVQLGMGTNTAFVNDLKRNSRQFAQISQEFVELGAALQIRSFYETVMMGGQLTVDRESAILGLPNELAVGIAGANHSNICKFDSPTSQKYRPVLRALDELVEKAQGKAQPSRVLGDLEFSYIPYQRNPRFTGRSEILKEIQAHFKTNPDNAFILRGMGGIGKSSIALEYAHRSLDEGMMVLWVDCTSRANLAESFKRLLETFHSEQRVSNLGIIRSMAVAYLEKRGNWLLIFDNADDGSIPYGDWIPRGGQVLLTTRDERLAHKILAFQKELPLMNDQEASALFFAGNAQQSTSTPQTDMVQRLIQRLGNLPLAISLASAYLREYTSVSLATYLQSLENFDNRRELLSYKEAFSSYNHSVLSTWEISLEKVQRDNPRAASILILLGFLANKAVTRKHLISSLRPIVSRGLERTQVLHHGAAAKDLQFLDNPLLVEQALGLLKALALIDDEGVQLSLHPLVYEWTQARLEPKEIARYSLLTFIVLADYYMCWQYPDNGRMIDTDYVNTKGLRKGMAGYALFIPTAKLDPVTEQFYISRGVDVEMVLKRMRSTQSYPDKYISGQTDFWSHMNVTLASAVKFKEQIESTHYECYLFMLTILIMTGSPVPSLPKNSSVTGSRPVSNNPFFNLSHTEDPPTHTSAYTDLAACMLKCIPVDHREIMDGFTNVAKKIISFKHWAHGEAKVENSESEHYASGPLGETDAPKYASLIQTYVERLQDILVSIQQLAVSHLPDEIADFLFIWTSTAAENFGLDIPIWLEKPIRETRVQLYYEANCLGRRFEPLAGKSLTLKGTVAFARYVDMQVSSSKTWLLVEECLALGLGTAKDTMRLAEFSTYLDLLCQSLWESNHEDALYGLVKLSVDVDDRVSNKWQTRLANRWKEIGRLPVPFRTLQGVEKRLIDAIFPHFLDGQKRLPAEHFKVLGG